MNLEHARTILERAGVAFDNGLTDREIEGAEHRFGFVFPDDLRAFLMFAFPKSSQFPNWRDLDNPNLISAMSWPLEWMWFDVQHNRFWPNEWGAKPLDDSEALEQLRDRIKRAPRLIPISGHRYMPDRPRSAGNPVFSVYQTDIIYYGADLENYLHNEYHYYFGTPEYNLPEEIRQIDFWSALVN